jgi:glutamate racemase
MGVLGKIGVFDSGFGGLHTLRHIVAELPQYDYVYLGDSARTPYGPRTRDEVQTFSTQAVDFLFSQGAELIIFACNTASSEALRAIQQSHLPGRYSDTKVKKNVLGVLIPLAEKAVEISQGKRIGVLATQGTVRSGAFVRELTKIDPTLFIVQEAAPKLASLIEAGEHHTEATAAIIKGYVQPLMDASIDTLILGCTHYGFVRDVIQSIVGSGVAIVSEADAVPQSLCTYLTRHVDIDDRLTHGGTREFFTTDTTVKFDTLGSTFFGAPLQARRIILTGD